MDWGFLDEKLGYGGPSSNLNILFQVIGLLVFVTQREPRGSIIQMLELMKVTKQWV